jgi:hypothetical protein
VYLSPPRAARTATSRARRAPARCPGAVASTRRRRRSILERKPAIFNDLLDGFANFDPKRPIKVDRAGAIVNRVDEAHQAANAAVAAAAGARPLTVAASRERLVLRRQSEKVRHRPTHGREPCMTRKCRSYAWRRCATCAGGGNRRTVRRRSACCCGETRSIRCRRRRTPRPRPCFPSSEAARSQEIPSRSSLPIITPDHRGGERLIPISPNVTTTLTRKADKLQWKIHQKTLTPDVLVTLF